MTSKISEYSNGKWRDGGKLASFKTGTSSISYGVETMIIGGNVSSGRLVKIARRFQSRL